MNNRYTSWLRMELKGMRSGTFWLVVAIYLLLLTTILFRTFEDGAAPNPMQYNEMLSFLLCTMAAILFFQREWGAGSMETIASYPMSLTAMTIRKWGLAIILMLIAQAGWMTLYVLRFGQMSARVYPWDGGEAITDTVHMIELLIQPLPAMLFMISITIFGMVLSQKLYGGLALGFAWWLLDTMTMGAIFRHFTLYTTYLDMREVPFVLNRGLLVGASLILLIISIFVINRRHRYTKESELE
ncbi:hypothetical protein ACFSVM_19805 [Paenibacillus shunpengii]|uniref:ABC-2 type transport system permease protein n=1 Tax=Paenibacillus shunpengii TaxID=2054424 RepID=A0ABW5SSA2_9BACL|nr:MULTISPECIES: hypothetical protein [unclassified Paenibacillus]OMC64050.1 hypothetical protein BK126_25785 [Paenibacillus sp. FSL H7-0326]SDX66943.1 hypothetical protein SAMN05518848_11161 [Paenibacillus sp. PDC88]